MTTSSMSANSQATCARLAKALTEIVLDPETTRRFVAEMTAPRGRVQELLASGLMFAQESLVATGDLDAVTRF